MAEQDLFEFDSEEEENEVELGGFNDIIDFEEEVAKVEKEIDPEKKDDEDNKEEDKTTTVVEEKTPVVNESTSRLEKVNVDNMVMIGELNEQVKQLQRQSETKKEDIIQEVDLPTDEDWETDPKAAAEKLAEVRETDLKSKLEKESDEKFLKDKEYEVFNTQHRQSWEHSAQLVPELAEVGSDMRNAIGAVYEKANLKNHPIGPMLATCAAMVAKAYKQMGSDTTARDEGAQMERSRQDRLNQGTMTGDGGSNSSGGIELDSMHIATAKQLGIPIDVYKKSLQMIQ